jgi:hypothetical protein
MLNLLHEIHPPETGPKIICLYANKWLNSTLIMKILKRMKCPQNLWLVSSFWEKYGDRLPFLKGMHYPGDAWPWVQFFLGAFPPGAATSGYTSFRDTSFEDASLRHPVNIVRICKSVNYCI